MMLMRKNNIIERPTKESLESFKEAQQIYKINYKKLLLEFLPLIEYKVFKVFQETIDRERKVQDFNSLPISEQVDLLKRYCKDRLTMYINKHFDIFNNYPSKIIDLDFNIREVAGSGQQISRIDNPGNNQTYFVNSTQQLQITFKLQFAKLLSIVEENEHLTDRTFKVVLSYNFKLESLLGWN